MPITYVTTYACPLGRLTLESDGRRLTRVRLPGEAPPPAARRPRGGATADADARVNDPQPFAEAIAQLDEYFAGARRKFDLPLAPQGTPFQLKVWRELRKVPYGKTITYATLARRAGNEAACRAVGAANGRNPIPLVIPCHRVVGANQRLTGFFGGVALKAKLLAIEGLVLTDEKPSPESRVLASGT